MSEMRKPVTGGQESLPLLTVEKPTLCGAKTQTDWELGTKHFLT